MKRRAVLILVLYVVCLLADWRGARRLYLDDPFGISLGTVLLFGALTAASYAANYFITSRRKVAPVDRGRFEDIRLQGNGYGEHIIRGYGKFRCAGILIDATEIVHTTSETPGQPGGKGTPKPPTPGEIRHVYTSTHAVAVCEVLGDLSPDLQITRIWAGTELIYDTTVTTQGDAFYEAERAGNTLAGGATVVADADASGGQAVEIPQNGSVQFNGVYGSGAACRLEFYLNSTITNSVEMNFIGVPFADSIGNTGGVYGLGELSNSLTLSMGFTNTIRIKNLSATPFRLDRLCVRFSGQGTGVINQHTTPPDPSVNMALVKAGEIPEADADGTITAQVVAGGNANIRIYTGTETQTPDSALVAIHGAANTPAYRGLVYVVFDSYQLKDPFIPNYTFEVDTGCYAVDDIVTDLYDQAGVESSDLDVTALASDSFDADEGLVLSSREQAGKWIEDLQTVFQFDMPEVDGKAKAVKRDGASVATFEASELRGHWDGEEHPEQEIVITDIDELALPHSVTVGYMDALNDYHNNVQTATRGSGNSHDPQTVNLPMVLTANRARQLAETILYQRHLESRGFKIIPGPKGMKLHPGLVVTINATNATHTGRIEQQDIQIMGPVELELVRVQPSVYSQTIAGTSGSGYETPVVEFPGNAKALILDTAILRPEDAGDGTQPVVYIPTCLRGDGTYRGVFVHKEVPVDSGSYQAIAAIDTEASIGVVTGSIGTVDVTVWDRDTEFEVNFYPVTTLESKEEADIGLNPELNLFAVGSMEDGWYLGRFSTVSAGVASSPYQSRYTVSGFLWDGFGQGAPPAGSLDGLDFVLLNSAIKPLRVPLEDFRRERRYRFPTSGQSVLDAPETVEFTLEAVSLKPLAPVNVRGTRNAAGDLLIEWLRRERIASFMRDLTGTPINEEKEVYQIEVYDGVDVAWEQRITGRTATPVMWSTLADPDGSSGSTAVDSDGTLTVTDVYAGEGFPSFAGDWVFELTVGSDRIPAKVGMGEVAISPWDMQTSQAYAFAPITSTSVTLDEDSSAGPWTVAPGDRLSIERKGDTVYYYLNRSETTPPLYQSKYTPAGRTFKPFFENLSAGTFYAGACSVLLPVASYLYPAILQTEHFGSPQSSVTVIVYQESAIVGRGLPAEATV